MTTAVERLDDRRVTRDRVRDALAYLSESARRELPARFLNFLDVAGSATSRASYYSTKDEILGATKMAHTSMLAAERGVYAASLCLPGATHFNRQLGLMTLLATPRVTTSVLTEEQERRAIGYIADQIPVTNLLRTADWIVEGKMTSAKTKKLLARRVIAHDNFPFWCMKYRGKMARLLTHVIGSRKLVRNFVAGEDTPRQLAHLDAEARQMARFALGWNPMRDATQDCGICELLQSFYSARTQLEAGKLLPPEILEGIRSRYHPGVPKGRVLEIARDAKTITAKGAMRVQRAAAEAGVAIDVDWKRQEAVALYLYAYERGMNGDIRAALDAKASKAAAGLPLSFQKLSIIVDYSDSMRGSRTQKLRPMACAMATRDMLMAAADEPEVFTTSHPGGDQGLPRPNGHTDLASALVRALKNAPDAVALITDGYENAPAGRVDQVLDAARRIGCETPVYQLTPVMAAETASIRKVSALVSAMPVFEPASLGVGLMKSAFEASLEQGTQALLNTVLPLIEN